MACNLKSEERERAEMKGHDAMGVARGVVGQFSLFFNFVDETTGSKIVGVCKGKLRSKLDPD